MCRRLLQLHLVSVGIRVLLTALVLETKTRYLLPDSSVLALFKHRSNTPTTTLPVLPTQTKSMLTISILTKKNRTSICLPLHLSSRNKVRDNIQQVPLAVSRLGIIKEMNGEMLADRDSRTVAAMRGSMRSS
jgi:hypothetical protein